MILTNTEIEKIMADFLLEHSDELECKLCGYEDRVCREGEKHPKIFIVNEGVFRISKLDMPNGDATVGFCFKPDIITPIIINDDYASLFEIKSIENNLSKYNSIYEIPIEQWNYFAEKNEKLKLVHLSVIHNNLTQMINLFSILRQNRNTKNILYRIYKMNHPILNSGIPDKYLADFFGLTLNTFHKIIYKIIKNENSKY